MGCRHGWSGPRRGAAELTGSVRIIGGKWRGRRLPVPDRQGLRPSPARVRETLFNWLAIRVGGARCLDLFAGSGALGFEALSRGARAVVMVERDQQLVGLLEASRVRLGATQAEVARADAFKWLEQAHEPFDIVFLDPPFRQGRLARACALLAARGLLVARALVYAETETGARLALAGFTRLKQARAGAVAGSLYQYDVTLAQ